MTDPFISYVGIDVESALAAVHAERDAEFAREQRLVFGKTGPRNKGCRCTTSFTCGVCLDAHMARYYKELAAYEAQTGEQDEAHHSGTRD